MKHGYDDSHEHERFQMLRREVAARDEKGNDGETVLGSANADSVDHARQTRYPAISSL